MGTPALSPPTRFFTTSIDIFGSAKNPRCMFISTAPMDFGEVVRVILGRNDFETLIVCEHASNRTAGGLQGFGLDEEASSSHVAGDPGVPDVAQAHGSPDGSASGAWSGSRDSCMTATDRRNPQARWPPGARPARYPKTGTCRGEPASSASMLYASLSMRRWRDW